jgi:hypothetical protein
LPEKTSVTDAVLNKISEKVGSSESLQKIKFGRGTVGKIAVITVFCLVALAAPSLRLSPSGAVFAVAVMLTVFLCSLGAILFVVCKQPELAVLEGMELVRYKQVTIGSKDYTPERLQLPIPDPQPSLEDGGEEGGR